MKKYYCVTQYDKNAHEHRWVFDEAQYREACSTYSTNADGELAYVYNGADCVVSVVEGDEESCKKALHDWLLATGNIEVDLLDPAPIDLIEYYCTIDTDMGCADRFVTAKEITSFNKDTHDRRLDDLINLGLGNYLYSDKWDDMRYSEIMEIAGNDLRKKRLIGILEGKSLSLYSDRDIRSLTLDGFRKDVVAENPDDLSYGNTHVGYTIYGISMDEFLMTVYASDYTYDAEPFYAYEEKTGDITSVHFDTKYDHSLFYAGLFNDKPLVMVSEWDYNYFKVYNIDRAKVHSSLIFAVNPDWLDENSEAIEDGELNLDDNAVYDCDIRITLDIDGTEMTVRTGGGYISDISSYIDSCDDIKKVPSDRFRKETHEEEDIER